MPSPDPPPDDPPQFPEGASGSQDREPTADPPATVREFAATLAGVALFDLLIYRHAGYATTGVFLLGLVPLFGFGSPFRRANWRGFAFVAGLLALAAARLAWLGWGGAVVAGVALLTALTLARTGRRAWVTDLPLHMMQALPSAGAALVTGRDLFHRGSRSHHVAPPLSGENEHGRGEPAAGAGSPLSVLLPLAAGTVFAGLFLLANPDLKETVGAWLGTLSARFGDAIRWLVPGPGQMFLWAIVGGLLLGALRPLIRTSLLDPLALREEEDAVRRRATAPSESVAYSAVRNTLLVVVGVFAAYLPFEFLTLWRRDFPEGFYYAGYAHEGAAWLTVALAAATALLSALFRGSMTTDPRVARVRRLAWIWSGLNFLLVAAVLNRLLIYVEFNGLSRLRVVGFLGIAAVAAGFALVVAKIARNRGFTWLVRGQARAAALVILLGVLAPVDWLAHRYNAARVVAGDPAPLALIGNHDIDLGGLLALEPLLTGDDPIAARGVAGRLALAAADLDRPPVLRTRGARTREVVEPQAPQRSEPQRSGPLDRLERYQLARGQFRRMIARNRARIDALLAGDPPEQAAEELAAYGMRWW